MTTSKKNFDDLSDQDKEYFVEMLEFWAWARGSGKLLQWLAIVGFPIAFAIWAMGKWFKNH